MLAVLNVTVAPMPAHVVEAPVSDGLRQFATTVPKHHRLWIGPLEGNGGRDVVIYMPPSNSTTDDIQVIVHFHGTYSENIELKREGVPKKRWVGWNRLQQTIDATEKWQEQRDQSVVLVYPMSAGKRLPPDHQGWSNRAYDVMWMNPASPPEMRDDFDTLLNNVEETLASNFGIDRKRLHRPVIAQGHSAGGVALLNIAADTTQRVAEYLFLDAGFQDWADGTYRALMDAKSKAIITLVIAQGGMTDPTEGDWNPWCRTSAQLVENAPRHISYCARAGDKAKMMVGDKRWTCARVVEAIETWEDYHQWCDAMKTDMATIPNVFVYRTGVRHGDQPSQFTGGLTLPPRDKATWQVRERRPSSPK